MGIWFLSQYSPVVVLSILAQCVKGQSLGQQKPVSVLDGKLQLYQSPKTILLLALPEWPVPIRLAKYLQNCHFPIISGRQNKGRSYFVWKRLAEVRLCSVRAAHRLSLHVPPKGSCAFELLVANCCAVLGKCGTFEDHGLAG